MIEKKYLEYTTEEFVLDKRFTEWILHPDHEHEAFWSDFIKNHPEKKDQIDAAAFIIRGTQVVEPDIPLERLQTLFRKIETSQKHQRLRWLPGALKYAASLLVLFTLGALIYMWNRDDQSFPLAEIDAVAAQKGRVTLADGSTHEFDTKETTIKQTNMGALMINDDTIANSLESSKSKAASRIQVTIPYGKISDVLLADGTHIWLNSGSQLSYPTEFHSNSREVYLSGEAFLDVEPDPDKPFYVITQDLKIRVLGTQFNVSCYSEEPTTQTVLLEGKVTVARNGLFSKNHELRPGERLSYNKKEDGFDKDVVDVRSYASWINGYLIFESTPTTVVFKKIERFYNRRIIIPKNGLDQVTFSGKLDLQKDIEDVIQFIAFASSVKVIKNEDEYIINP